MASTMSCAPLALLYALMTGTLGTRVVFVLSASGLTAIPLYRLAARARERVWQADETVGVPVPGDLGEHIAHGGLALHAMLELASAAALEQPRVAPVMRPYRREICTMLRAHVRCLRRVRRHWVRGDSTRWRAHAMRLTELAERMDVLLDALDHRIRRATNRDEG